MVMSRDEVLKASESGDHVIIDARAPFRYDGSQVDTMDGMTGHILVLLIISWKWLYCRWSEVCKRLRGRVL